MSGYQCFPEMAPNSSDAAPAAEGFFERVLLLPALSDAIALVSHAYKTTQVRVFF